MLPFSILIPMTAPTRYRPVPASKKDDAERPDVSCLCCGRPFPSRGPEHRVCDTCKRVKEKS